MDKASLGSDRSMSTACHGGKFGPVLPTLMFSKHREFSASVPFSGSGQVTCFIASNYVLGYRES